MVKAMLKECLPIIALTLAGYWRDKYGRNLPLFIYSACGQLVGTIILLISSIYWKTISITVTVIVESTITGLSGSFPLLLMTSACYISSRTTPEARTSRMSFIMASYLGGMTIGFFLSGLTLQKYGFMGMFGVAVGLAVLVLVYIVVFIRDSATPVRNKSMPIWIILKTVFRKRGKHMRTVVLLMVIVHCLFGTTLRCEANVFMFFLEKSMHLNVAQTGVYTSYRSIILFISTFLVIPILSKCVKIKDVLLGIMCSTLNCASAIWTAFARTKNQLFLCPLGDLLRGGIFAVEKSIITKTVGPYETGQVISVEYVIEALCHLVVLPLYTYVFNKTAATFPGAFFFVSAIFSFCTLIIFCITGFFTRNMDLYHNEVKEHNNNSTHSSSSEENT